MDTTCGLFGKHPGFGDFISTGIAADVQAGVQGWLDAVLPVLRAGLGDDWENAWDNAAVLRFWIGRGLSGQTLAGVMQPSRDSVGRRYPLVLLACGGAVAAPVIDPDQAFYASAETLLALPDIKTAPQELARGLAPEDAQTRAEGPLIWAHNNAGNLDDLLRAAAVQDQHRAVTGRSYWWVKPRNAHDPALWLGHAGLPDAQGLGWLLFGRAVSEKSSHA